MQNWFIFGVQAIQLIALVLMGGGMMVLGSLVAPTVFHTLPHTNAALLMMTLFQAFDQRLQLMLAVVITTELTQWTIIPSLRQWVSLRLLGILTLATCIIYSTQVLNPEVAKLNQAGIHRNDKTVAGNRLNAQHKQSETLYKIQCFNVLLLIVLIALPARQSLQSSSFKNTPDSLL
jgi:hypothetical protein